jgi:hypothetical protein
LTNAITHTAMPVIIGFVAFRRWRATHPIDPGIVTAFRNLMNSIVVQPTGYRQPYVVDAYGRLSAIMGVNLFPTARSGEEIVAEEGVRSAVISANAAGQVQRGNTCRELHREGPAVLFMGCDAL